MEMTMIVRFNINGNMIGRFPWEKITKENRLRIVCAREDFELTIRPSAARFCRKIGQRIIVEKIMTGVFLCRLAEENETGRDSEFKWINDLKVGERRFHQLKRDHRNWLVGWEAFYKQVDRITARTDKVFKYAEVSGMVCITRVK